MKIAFLHSDKSRERLLADAFLMGARAHGHETIALSLGQETEADLFDVAVMVGVKSRERFYAQRRLGRHVIMLDKGYSRHKREGGRTWEFWRTAVDAHQPTSRLSKITQPDDRMVAAGWRPKRWRKSGAHIIVAGSSEKYHAFYGLVHPTRYARGIVLRLWQHSQDLRIVYRPKPSWHDATPLKRAAFSRPPESLSDLLPSAHALITHGSNACFDAVMAGVPAIVLGDGVAKPISSTSLKDIDAPLMVDSAIRRQWLANLAYFQWTESEMASGECWAFLQGQIHG